jgi:hypothetical protein
MSRNPFPSIAIASLVGRGIDQPLEGEVARIGA